jgi:hypothetical protein
MQITKARLKEIIKEEIENMDPSVPDRHPPVPESTPPSPSSQSYRGFQFDIPPQDEEGNVISEEIKFVYLNKMQDVIDSFYV